MADEEKKRGGSRPNSGRHRVKDPKRKIILYFRESKILNRGGEDKMKAKIYSLIEGEGEE